MVRSHKWLNGSLYHLFVLAVGFIMLYPILWMAFGSFKLKTEIFGTATLLPSKFVFDNYLEGWKGVGGVPFVVFFKNSFYYVILATLGTVISSAFVAYGFARIKFAGRKFWFAVMLITMMLPVQVVMIPQFILFYKLGWTNSFKPLIIPLFTGVPFFIFLMIQFIRGLPIELDESAKIDGCGRLRIFYEIILPLITPALITSTIFQFYWQWDNFLGPLLYLNKPKMYTVSLALRMFSDPSSDPNWGAIFAMGTLSLLPIFIIFLIFQKYLVEGISTSGIKG